VKKATGKAKSKGRARTKAKRPRARPARSRSTRAAKGKRAKPAPKRRAAARPRGGTKTSRWLAFVAKHGVVLASAKGPVPSVAEAVAGEPIVGSWWAHPKGQAIFTALSEIDDSADVRSFKLVDGKITLVHRRAWPALVRLGREGVIAPEQLASLQQEHMPTGEHRNIVTPFPDWVDDETARAAEGLSTEKARAQLAWIDAA
jgi:hypothetical protein